MYCRKCGKVMPDGAAFCGSCGAPVVQVQGGGAPGKHSPGGAHGGAGKPLGKKLWLIVGAAAVVVIALILVLIIGGAKKKDYQAALAAFEAERYSEAAEAFEAMGNYKDAAEQAALSRKWETYAGAEALLKAFDRRDTEEAGEIFLSLGTFEDAADRAEYCRNRLAYDDAEQLEKEEQYEEAKAAFKALGDFEDAKACAQRCTDAELYIEALGHIKSGYIAQAAELLEGPAERNYGEAPAQYEFCRNTLDYAAAIEALGNGKYYDAYKVFSRLGAFEDAAQYAKDCIQETPKSGQMYRNKAYPTTTAQINMVNTDGRPTVYKFYSNGDLVSTVFIRAGEKAMVAIPVGVYAVNQAYGSMWFGLNDLFGDEGEYMRCKDNGSYDFTFKNAYEYTFKSDSGGNPLASSDTTRAEF